MSLMNKRPNFKKLTKSTQLINLRDRLFRTDNLIKAGKTPFNTIYEDVESKGLVKLRHYPAPDGYPTLHAIPIVIVPPLAVNMLIYDLFENRSFVRFLLEQGFSVYMLDWGSPTRKQTHYDFEQYVLNFMPKLFEQVRQHSRQQQLTLHCWSLSGIFALLYAAATKDPDIKNLIILGTPINTYRSGAVGAQVRRLGRAMKWLEHRTGYHPRNLPAGLLHSYGWSNAFGFTLLNMKSTMQSHLSMLRHLGNRQAIENHATNSAFLNHMVDYPGCINRDMLIKVWLENGLSQGKFKIGGQLVNLKEIKAALFVGAGRTDTMVTAAAMLPLTSLVGSEDTIFMSLPGGHVGMIASNAAAQESWPELAAWLEKRSN
jgi:polyhydroxyalkanoate synthase